MAQNENGTWECAEVDVNPIYVCMHADGEDRHVGELLLWDAETLERGDSRAAVPLTRERAQQLIEELQELLAYPQRPRVRLDRLSDHHLFYMSYGDRTAWEVLKVTDHGVSVREYRVFGDPAPTVDVEGGRMVYPV